jgi:ribonuclease BN (tRNA processing enzyme)
MLVTLLGTGAPLMPDRATTGMLVTAPGCAPLLIDTCGGFELPRQLAAAGIPLSDVKNVIVTHRHMDHAGGMQALILARMPLDVYASSDTHSGVVTMTAGCFPEWEPHAEFNRPEVRAGDTREIGGFEVTFFEARHRVPTLAVRVSYGGKTFAFSADSIPCDAIVECARNADLFLCDAICAEADGETAARRARELMHPTARDAATMATRAGAARLACTHIGRFGNPERILDEAQRAFAGPVLVPRDLERIAL